MPKMEFLGSKLMVLSQILSVIFPTMMAIDSDCNYLQSMSVGVTYYVYNPEYPYNYPRNRECRWQLNAPQGYIVEAECSFEMPQTSGCIDDRVEFDLTGNANFGAGHVYCGYGNDTIKANANSLTIGLFSSYQSIGGRFLCSVQAKSVSDPSQCDCGVKNTRRIVGGVPTMPNEFPYMCALYDERRKDLFCGATIINSRFAITAAHCFTLKDPSYVGLLVGEHDVNTAADSNATKIIPLIQFIPHPDFTNNYGNDIGLVKTDRPIEYNFAVSPVCLPIVYYQYSFAAQVVKALGWGTTEFTGPTATELLETDLDVLDVQTCYVEANGTSSNMCTFREGHDTCQKDSGGPLLWYDENTNRYFIVGIVSSGYGCASPVPSLNTRVTSYLMWILSNTVDSDICIKGQQ